MATLLLLLFGFWYSRLGNYRPRIPPAAPRPISNGFEDYQTASSLLMQTLAPGSLSDYRNESPGINLSDARSVVANNQAALVRVQQAFSKACMVPSCRGALVMFPHFEETQYLACLLLADADVKGARGDYAAACDAALDAIAMAQDLTKGGTTYHPLCLEMPQTIARERILRYAPHLNSADCDRLAARLGAILKAKPSYLELLQEEDAGRLEAMAKMKGVDAAVFFTGSRQTSSGMRREWERFSGSVTWHIQRNRYLRDLEDYSNAAAAETHKPYAQRKPVPVPQRLVGVTAPVSPDMHIRYDLIDVRNRILLLELKIRSYLVRQQRLPATLGALSVDPMFVNDPFSEKPFRYLPQGQDYLLYSIGPDATDEGGVPANEMLGFSQPSGDIGIKRLQYGSQNGTSRRTYRLVPHMKPPVPPPVSVPGGPPVSG